MPNVPESFTPTVLVVNDALETLKLIEFALINEGFRVLTAVDGHPALEIALNQQVDAVVSDVVMPEMDGIELCSLLKKNPRTANIPVLLISAVRTKEQDSLVGLYAGADDYITMPLRQTELLIKLTRLIERARMERSLRQSEARYQTVIQNSSVIFFATDRNGVLTLSEGAGLKKLNLESGEAVGKSVFDLYENYPSVLENIRLALEGETFTGTAELGDLTFDVNYYPLRDEAGELSGTVGVATDVTERFAAERKAAVVIEQLGSSVEREALINRISNAVRESLRVEDVFRAVVNELGAHLGVDRCHLYFFDETAGVVRPAAQFAAEGIPLISNEEIPFSLANRILVAFRENGYIAIDDVAAKVEIRELYENILRPRGVRSIMLVAVRVRGEITGLLSLVTTTYHKKWSEADVALARAVSDQAGIAIRQAELYQQAEFALKRERLINQLSTAIRSSLQLPDVLHTATYELGRALGVSRVYLRFYKPQPAKIPPVYVYTAPETTAPFPPTVEFLMPIGQYIVQNNKTVVINDVLDLPSKYAEMQSYVSTSLVRREIRSAVYCPLLVNGKFRGSLCIEQTDRLRRWTESDIALIEAVAAQLSLGIAHGELFELTRNGKRQWEATFNAMSDGIFFFDKDGFLIRVNEAGAAMEKAAPQEILGRKCCTVLTSQDGKQPCLIEEVIKTRKTVTVEFVSKLIDRPLLTTVEPVIDRNDQLLGVVCTARDIYELRLAEAVARERQSVLTHILEGMLEPVFAVDADGRLMWSNKATHESYGSGMVEINSRSFAEMVHPEDREMAKTALEASLKKLPQCYESRYLTDSGETRYAVFNSVPLMIESEFNGVLWFLRDITQQKIALQQALQADKLRALGQLASGVAHDFNNVLAAIQGRVSLLERQDLNESVRHNLQIIQTAAEDAAATVRRIQSFARQSAEPDFATVDVGSLLSDTVELLRPRWHEQALERDIEYAVNLNVEGSFLMSGNASELREVFVNLLINALDAMPQGGELKIECGNDDKKIEIWFTDNGRGIPNDVIERIFEPFFSTKGVSGMGLGLSVSYGIIKQHGGEISVESKVGEGSTFKITLPVQIGQQEASEMGELNGEKKNLSILVVDDEELVREALMDMVSELATEVDGAEDVSEALDKLNSRHFDVVFTDLSMPEMDGLDLAREISQNWETTKTVLVTGYGKGLAIAPEKREFVHAVIGKPFNFEQLSQTLEKITLGNENN